MWTLRLGRNPEWVIEHKLLLLLLLLLLLHMLLIASPLPWPTCSTPSHRQLLLHWRYGGQRGDKVPVMGVRRLLL
jgi:hypothetical protein